MWRYLELYYSLDLLDINVNHIIIKKDTGINITELYLKSEKMVVNLDFIDDHDQIVIKYPLDVLEDYKDYILYFNGNKAYINNDSLYHVENINNYFALCISIESNHLSISKKRRTAFLLKNSSFVKTKIEEIHLLEEDNTILFLGVCSSSYLAIRYKNEYIDLPTKINEKGLILDKEILQSHLLPYGKFRLYLIDPFLDTFVVAPININNIDTPLNISHSISIENRDSKTFLLIEKIGKSINKHLNIDSVAVNKNFIDLKIGEKVNFEYISFYIAAKDYNMIKRIESNLDYENNSIEIKIPHYEVPNTLYDLVILIGKDLYGFKTKQVEKLTHIEDITLGLVSSNDLLNIYVGDKSSYVTKYKKSSLSSININEVYVESSNLLIKVNNYNVPDKFKLYLINGDKTGLKYNLKYFYDRENILIDLQQIKDLKLMNQGEWIFYIESSLQNYIIYESFRLTSCESKKSVFDMETYERNAQRYCKGVYVNDQGMLCFCHFPEEKYYQATRTYKKGDILISNVDYRNGEFDFSLENMTLYETDLFEIILVPRKNSTKLVLSAQVAKKGIKCSFENKRNLVKALRYFDGRADIFGKYISNNNFMYGRLVIQDTVKKKIGINYFEVLNNHSILLYRTDANKLSIVEGKSQNIFKESHQIKTKLIELKRVANRGYKFSAEIKSNNRLTFDKVILKLRSKDKVKEIYIEDFKVKVIDNTKIILIGFLEMNWDSFFPLYWDLFVQAMDDEYNSGLIRVSGATKSVINKISKDYYKQAIKDENGYRILYPYVTFDDDISFMMREKEPYETYGYKVKESLAYYVYLLLKKLYFNKRDIWLGFEKFSKTAQDNGYAFFKYVEENQLHDDFYFVLDSNSPDYEHVINDSKNIVKFMSFKYFLLVYASKLLISSETKRHVHNIRIRTGKVAEAINNKKSVFLQHGVTGLKMSDVFKKSKGRGSFDLVIATSEMEKEIINKNWNYNDDEIIVTGFSRWDLLYDKSKNVERKRIFVMPTWRTWMEDMPKEEFVKSVYYLNYVQILKSEEINRILSQHNLELVFFLHPKFKQYVSEFQIDNPNISVKEFLEIKVNEEIMESSLMISDYSSVTWDMFYLNKPVIFYQFDYDKYVEFEGSYINMEEDLFGERATNIDELITLIKNYVDNGFMVKEEYQKLHSDYFTYVDHNNAKRTFKEIKRLMK